MQIRRDDVLPHRRPPVWMDPSTVDRIRCRQRILVVTDSLNFTETDQFGLSAFVDELQLIAPPPIVTTRTRGSGAPAFRFDGTVTTANFDQIWLFGATGAPLEDDEVQVMWRFMEDGGGVFATGDHLELGLPLCGDLPRVRKMREWRSTPMVDERIDTLTNPGVDRFVQFDDQGDEFPQRIFPHYRASGPSWFPHPILRSPAGDIDVLPDHPHESVCLAGGDLSEQYAMHGLVVEEFPGVGGRPLSPEIIASSVSAGRHVTDTGKPPTTPRLFGAISVWDGHRVGKGRIVTDATWHHFVNVNLDGTGTRSGRPGLAAAPRAQVGEYFRNIADWLVPTRRRWCHRWFEVVVQRYEYPLFEEWQRLPDGSSWEDRVALGRLVEAAFEANRGRGHTAELVAEALALGKQPFIEKLLRLRSSSEPAEKDHGKGQLLIDVDAIRHGLAGSIFDALVRDLPATGEELKGYLADSHDDDHIVGVVAAATGAALQAAREHYRKSVERTLDVLDQAWEDEAFV